MLATQQDMESKTQWLQRLQQARERTDELFGIVRQGSLYERPIAERHRIIFYVGHLEAFDLNLLRGRWLALESFRPEFDKLFAFGIDPVGGGLPTDRPEDWPSVGQVKEYVTRVRKELDAQIEMALSSEPEQGLEFPPGQLLNTAIEHRLMHAETLAYMLHQLPTDEKVRKDRRPAARVETAAITPAMIQIPGGSITLGLPRDSGIFGWDNEFESHVVKVPPFAIDQYPVTNGEYEEFVAAGGYDNRSLWNEADWKWKTEAKVSHPIFWKPATGGWLYRTMFEEVPLPSRWPVYVSMAEASAYAKWKGQTLPSEAQWNRAAFAMPDGLERQYPWGDEAPSAEFGNFDFAGWDPVPVGGSPRGQSGFGVADMVGNDWEWTSTVFGPFPGFKRFPFYPGYSADFFDGQHFVMKGGSAQTAACMLRRSFRNWFQPHYQYVYAGFRCVSS